MVADRVRDLRERAGMSQTDLAAAMTELGVPWKRSTVVGLEKRSSASRGSVERGRDALTIQEWLVLALVLGVTPVSLLADPLQIDEVPVGPEIYLTTWDALGWITGAMAVDPRNANVVPDPQSGWALRQLLAVSGALEEIARAPDVGEVRADDGRLTDDPAAVRAVVEQRERSALETIRDVLSRIGRAGVAPPAVHPYIARRAAALDVDLGPHGRDWMAEPDRGDT